MGFEQLVQLANQAMIRLTLESAIVTRAAVHGAAQVVAVASFKVTGRRGTGVVAAASWCGVHNFRVGDQGLADLSVEQAQCRDLRLMTKHHRGTSWFI